MTAAEQSVQLSCMLSSTSVTSFYNKLDKLAILSHYSAHTPRQNPSQALTYSSTMRRSLRLIALFLSVFHLPATTAQELPGGNTLYISFNPAIYLFGNNPPSPSFLSPSPSLYSPYALPSPSTNSPPYAPTTFPTPYNPYAFPSLIPSITPTPSPSPSTTTPFLPATPLATLSCAQVGEPWWGCLSTENCAFDDVGDVACYPVGDFCRGVVSNGNGAGPRAGEVSGGRMGRAMVDLEVVLAISGVCWGLGWALWAGLGG
ncbi:hypothetical protein MMC13_000754 [Lambiella insularis]|nr:hypothetical protein [Lambiella insularis]